MSSRQFNMERASERPRPLHRATPAYTRLPLSRFTIVSENSIKRQRRGCKRREKVEDPQNEWLVISVRVMNNMGRMREGSTQDTMDLTVERCVQQSESASCVHGRALRRVRHG